MSGYALLGAKKGLRTVIGVVPPFQVLQQQNAGLPPGGVPPWYAQQYPAGYVPPLLISVDNPMEGDPFDAFDEIRFRGERDRHDLARSGLQPGWNAPTWLGDITDTVTDYDAGERLVLQMNQVLNALQRPKEFEAAAEAIWSAYEKAKVYDGALSYNKLGKYLNATAMKQVGQDAAQLTAKMQKAYPSKLATAPSSNIPKTNKPFWSDFSVPWWVWALSGTAAVGIAGYLALPFILPLLARRPVVASLLQ